MHAPVDYSPQSKNKGLLYHSSERQQCTPVAESHTVGNEALGDAKTSHAAGSSSVQPQLDPAFIDDSEVSRDDGKQSDLAYKALSLVDIQPPPTSQSVNSVMDEGHQGKASLEMLSVAVESLENMIQEGHGSMEKESTEMGNKAFVKFTQRISGNMQNDASAGTSRLKNFTGKLSELSDKLTTSGEDMQNKDHFLNMLCELAAFQQQEHELSDKPLEQVPLHIGSLLNDDVTSGEPKRVSFVDLLRKQMVHADAATTDAQTFYEQLVHHNQAFLGKAPGNQMMVCSINVSKDGPENHSKTDQISLESSHNSKDVNLPSLKDKSDSGYVCAKPDEIGSRESDSRAREENRFRVGDLVWGKVKSHPWWPGQVFDAADASTAARKMQKPGRVLVAFFGDGTFNWMQQSHLIAFRPYFEEKVKQTTMKSFCRAISEALDEVCRRTEVGLRCARFKGALYSKHEFPGTNAGLRKGVRLKSHRDICMSSKKLRSERALEFVKTIACCPTYSLFSGLEYAELTGHVYGFRNFILGPGKCTVSTMRQDIASQEEVRPLQSSKRKNDIHNDVELNEVKRPHLDADMVVEKQQSHSKNPSLAGRSPNVRTMEILFVESNDTRIPDTRTMENLLVKEFNETRLPDTKTKSTGEANESTWLAKGKRLHVLSEDRGKKRSKVWQLLGLLGNPKDSRVSSEEAYGFSSPEDDTKTLFDMTGYLFVKKKMKNKRGESSITKGICFSPSGKIDEVSVGASQELLPDKELEKAAAVEGLELLPNKVDELPCVQLQESYSVQGEEEDSHGTQSLGIPIAPHCTPNMSAGIKETYNSDDFDREECTFLDLKESEPAVVDLKDQSGILKKKRLTTCLESQGSEIVSEAMKTRDDTPEKGGLSHLETKEEESTEPAKISKPSASIKKAAGVLKGTSLNKKCAGDTPVKKLVGVTNQVVRSLDSHSESPKILVSAHTESFHCSLAKIINSLQAVARDPVSSAVMRSSLQEVMSVFLRFRSMVFVKSPGYGKAGVRKTAFKAETRSQRPVVHSSKASVMAIAAEKPRSSDDVQYPSADADTSDGRTPQSGLLGSQRLGLQELAVVTLKKKSEALAPARIEAPKVVPGHHIFKNRSSKVKVLHPRHLPTSVKHHVSRSDSSSLLQEKSRSSQFLAKAKASLGLFLQFPRKSVLPSEAELKAKFDPFGTLRASGITVFQDSWTAQVVYKNSSDAEMALQHVKKNRMFGHVDVSYMLRNFYPSSKMPATARNSSAEKTNVKLSALDSLGRLQVPRDSVVIGTEPEVTLLPAQPDARSPLTVDEQEPVKMPGQTSIHQEAFQTGSLHEDPLQQHPGGLSQNPSMIHDAQIVGPPPVSPSGDIEDQMMKLLQQLSVLVSSSALIQKPM